MSARRRAARRRSATTRPAHPTPVLRPSDDPSGAAGILGSAVSATPARAPDQSMASVLTALAANTTIAAAKGTAAALTGSPALLAETLHTLADAGNEVLLWIALRRSRRPPDASHPLGYGPERYYWALLAA